MPAARSRKKSPAKPPKHPYFNRELSWLAFNRRVLEQARDERFPLLERLRFLTFVSSNLDEFFEIRVAGVIQQVESGSNATGPDGLPPREQLRRIQAVSADLVSDMYACWREQIAPALEREGVVFKGWEALNRRELRWLKTYFEEQVQPVLTPLAIDPAHPFPQFGNKSLNILLWLDDPDTAHMERMLAFLPVPRILPRIVQVPGTSKTPPCYLFQHDIIKMFARHLFPGYKIVAAHAFRITRNSDLYIDEEEVENLLHTIEEELYNRRKNAAVRLEIEASIQEALLDELLVPIRLSKQHVSRVEGPINLMRLSGLYNMVERPELKFPAFTPAIPRALWGEAGLFEVLRRGDLLLHHPYDSFEPVVDFFRQAAVDPAVLAIKVTLYRTGSDSPIVKALIAAARHQKQVTVLIELKARFDEQANIDWARQMEEEGIHVVYGLVGLKTHCKCALVVRREGGALRRYAHLGTGNYHSTTARLYTDVGLLTAREDLTDDVADVFNTLTGFAKKPEFKRLLVAPYTLHARLNDYILQEARDAKAGHPARIIVKCNSLLDRETIDNLYAASKAGVQIDLIIRGICGLVPGVPGLSENIRVRSLLGRFLEHSRLFYFANSRGNRPHLLAGSADWMPRNFYRRIEVVFPIEDEALRRVVLDEILEPTLRDNQFARLLQPDGSYVDSASARVKPREGDSADSKTPFNVQEQFMALARERQRPPDPQPDDDEAGAGR